MSATRVVALSALLSASSSALAAPGTAPGCGPFATLDEGQARIDAGLYEAAIAAYTCVLRDDPLEVDAYRGRAEAELMLGHYSDAFHEYWLLVAAVQPPDIDALGARILSDYDARLAAPTAAALTGASFARWVFWDYRGALPLLDALLATDPDDVYANLFRGSSRLFGGKHVSRGREDLERAIALAPDSADVRYIVADAYTYAYPDPDRAWDEAQLALTGGLDTPRVHAILATVLDDEGDLAGAAWHIDRHIDLVTTETVATAPLAAGQAMGIELWPGRTHAIPIEATAGQAITLGTDSPSDQIWDSILVLMGPDGTPAVGADDTVGYFAGIDWIAPTSGTYTLRVTSFEAVSTGPLVVTRD